MKNKGILLDGNTPMILDNAKEELKDLFSFDNAREVAFHISYYFDGARIAHSMIETHRCIDLSINNIKEYYRITFDNGLILECSQGVKIMNQIKEFKYVDFYKVNDTVLMLKFDGKNTYIDKTTITAIEKVDSVISKDGGDEYETMFEVTSTEDNILIPKVLEDNTLTLIVVE